jgi:hypothetical protein
MLGKDKKQSDFKSRKEYLVALAIEYIEGHTGYFGVDDDIFFDETECDGLALAEDLRIEFDIDE